MMQPYAMITQVARMRSEELMAEAARTRLAREARRASGRPLPEPQPRRELGRLWTLVTAHHRRPQPVR